MTEPRSSSRPMPQRLGVIRRFTPAAPLGRMLVLVGLAIVSAAAAFAAFFVISLYDSELNAIRNRLEIPARAMADVAQQLLNDDALALDEVQAETERSDDLVQSSSTLRRLLVERATARPTVRRMALYDAEGKTIASSAGDLAVTNSDFFKRVLAAPSDRLVISGLIPDARDGQATVV